MIKLEKGLCTGCEACANNCPTEAIIMSYDEEGFHTPLIDAEKCISCHKCDEICMHLYDMKQPLFSPADCYAANGIDELRAKSSSGGAFSIIATDILRNKGIVWGAAYDEDYSVHHVMIDKEEDLSLLRTSKYLQSRIENGYKKVEEQLKQNRVVLFSGTPCQVYALREFLGRPYESLVCVDILCHGVPSVKDWLEYLAEHYDLETQKIDNINFRDKKRGWNYRLGISMKINGIYKRQDAYKNSYFRAFLERLNLRKSCYECQFARKERGGDITLGDFWEIGAYDDSEIDDRKGTSLVLVNTEKGRHLFDRVKKEFPLLKSVPFERAVEGNQVLSKPEPFTEKRERYFKLRKEYDIDTAVEKVLGKTSKRQCAIINFWWVPTDGYGASLTALALYHMVEEFEVSEPCLVQTVFDSSVEEAKAGRHYQFCARYAKCSKRNYITRNDCKRLNEEYTDFIVGSDQVFNLDYAPGIWFLPDVDNAKNKIAMAASFGKNSFKVPYFREKWISKHVNDFGHISLREVDGEAVYRKHFGAREDLTWILDPVFLVDEEFYAALERNHNHECPGKYVFWYILDETEETRGLKKWIKEKYGIEIFEDTNEYTAEDFLYFVHNAALVVTDSYHGMCFSIIYRRPFYGLYNKDRGTSRIDTLVKAFSIEENRTMNAFGGTERYIFFEPDNTKISEKLETERARGKKWLLNALMSHHSVENTRKYDEEEKVIIFGAGAVGRKALDLIGEDQVLFFVDNDEMKDGTELDGVPVWSFEHAKEILPDYPILVTVPPKYTEAIEEQLIKAGVNKENIKRYY